jgi:hypothetical protein
MDMTIPGMTAEWPWHPKHKIKFYAIGLDHEFRWLFRISFAKKDQSLYLTLLTDEDIVTRAKGSIPTSDRLHRSGDDFHLLLHESGIVNMTDSSGKPRVQGAVVKANPVRHIATLQFNSINNMPVASMDEINNPPNGYIFVPVAGFPGAPIMLSILCSTAEAAWSPPGVGNTMNLHYKTRMTGKAHYFHFVTWQNLAMSRGEGDIGILYGEKGNARFGL